MELHWSVLIPPILTVLIALTTRQIIVSLLIGILSGTCILANGHPLLTLKKTLFLIGDKIQNVDHVFIMLFIIILGFFFSLLYHTGASTIFGHASTKLITTRRRASLMTVLVSLFFFFDKYFSCFATGTLMKPTTDQCKISRAKLAYLIDTTTAPLCILIPITAYVTEVMQQLQTVKIGSQSFANPFDFFLQATWFNSYAWLSLFLVLLVILSKRDFGLMQAKELEAVIDSHLGANTNEQNYVKKPSDFYYANQNKPKPIDLMIPFFMFVLSCLGLILITGHSIWVGGQNNFLTTLEQASFTTSLFFGGLAASFFAVIYFLARNLIDTKNLGHVCVHSFKSSYPLALTILLALAFSTLVSQDLKTGVLLLDEINRVSSVQILPAMTFLITCVIAFLSGSSWTTFALMTPVVASLSIETAPLYAAPLFGAMISGAIFGDHTSPLSQTTIASSIGSGCTHMSHVLTQLPYAILTAIVCAMGYVFVGLFINRGYTFVTFGHVFFTLGALTIIFFLITKKPVKGM